MPRAFKGYPCLMKQGVKAIALILLLSLISGCSSSPEPADKPLAKTECEIAVEKGTELIDKASEVMRTEGRDAAKGSYVYWAFYTLERSECFSPEVLAGAKTLISLYEK
jgi:hypothetical protein